MAVAGFGTGRAFTAVDSTPPTVSGSPTINSAGTTLTVNFSEAVSGSEELGWNIDTDGEGAVTVSSGSGSGTTGWVLTLSRVVLDAETLNLDYDSSPGDATDGTGNALATFSNTAITNNSVQTDEEEETTDGPATLPIYTVDTTLPTGWDGAANATPTNAAELQTALDNAAAATGLYIIQLTKATTYTGSWELSNKVDSNWIVIRTSGFADLPAAGTRATASDITDMPTLAGNSTRLLTESEGGCHHFRFVGIHFTMTTGSTEGLRIRFGALDGVTGWSALADVPHHIIFDRCVAQGLDAHECRLFCDMSGQYMAFIDGTVENIWHNSQDAACFNFVNGPGPYLIENSKIEASGVNFFIGGADPAVDPVSPATYAAFDQRTKDVYYPDDPDDPTEYGIVPSDITCRRNHIFKRQAWKDAPSSYNVKNSWETKGSVRVLLEGNVVEGCWPDNQAGRTVNLKCETQNLGADWLVTSDITIRYNKFTNIHAWLNISAKGDGVHNTAHTVNHNFSIHDNLVIINANPSIGTNISGIEFTGPVGDLEIVHNTIDNENGRSTFSYWSKTGTSGAGNLSNNIFARSTNGIDGTSTGNGVAEWNAAVDGTSIILNNCIVGADSTNYPDPQIRPANWAAVGFADKAGGNYAVTGGAANNAASDGTDCGADITALNALISGVA